MMRLVKKFSAFVSTQVFLGAALVSRVLAQTSVEVKVCPDQDSLFGKLCNLTAGNLGTTIGRVITILLIVAVIISVIFLIWGGIRWITSGGDKGKVDSARGTIVAAIVGLILAFLAFFIVNVIFQVVLGQPLGALTLPSLTSP
jgi:hypothetical protein